jgi:hypothetical protein
MKQYCLDDMDLSEMILHQINLRLLTIQRAQEMVPSIAGNEIAHIKFNAQIMVLTHVWEDAKALIDQVKNEDLEEN